MDVQAYLMAPIPRWMGVVAVVASTAVSMGGTYIVLRKRYVETLDDMVRAEVRNSEKFLSAISTKKFASPQEAAEVLESTTEVDDQLLLVEAEALVTESGYVSSDDTGDKIEVARNVFTDAKITDFDFEAEVPLRSPDKPYIIEHDEYYESDRQMITLTWFEGDEVLSDEKDEHIPDIDRVVGEDNLLRFGYGSRDPNVIYIRNEKMDVDFEVVRNDGKYTEQVMGFIQHEDRKGPLKFRTYDD